MSERKRVAPRIVAYKTGDDDGGCSGCISRENISTFEVTRHNGNVTHGLRFCPECLKLASKVLVAHALRNSNDA